MEVQRRDSEEKITKKFRGGSQKSNMQDDMRFQTGFFLSTPSKTSEEIENGMFEKNLGNLYVLLFNDIIFGIERGELSQQSNRFEIFVFDTKDFGMPNLHGGSAAGKFKGNSEEFKKSESERI